MAPLPLAKLAGLVVKTLAKPLSKSIKKEFSRYHLTQRFLVNLGQLSHQVSSRMTIYSMGHRVRSVSALEEEKAMKEGAELFGETFILGVSVTILLWEYNRGKEKERIAEEKQQSKATEERKALQAQLHTLDIRLNALEKAVERNSASIMNLGGEKYKKPTGDHLVEIGKPEDI